MAEEIPDNRLVRDDPPWEGNRPSQAVLNMLEMMKTPNEWGRVSTYTLPNNASKTARDLRRGTRKKPPGRWEFSHGPTDDGRFGVWAKYLGPE